MWIRKPTQVRKAKASDLSTLHPLFSSSPQSPSTKPVRILKRLSVVIRKHRKRWLGYYGKVTQFSLIVRSMLTLCESVQSLFKFSSKWLAALISRFCKKVL